MSRKTYTFIAIALMSSAFGGCFAWNYVKVGYDNFSAYFNTFYNASVSFDAGMKDVKAGKKAYDLSLISGDHPAPFVISQNARQDFEQTIVEASKVLQYHPHSEFTEDCLFMIGISYYYQGDNLSGERKFLEVEATFPNTRRIAEAEMYYGAMELNGLKKETGRDRVLHAIRIARREGKRNIISMSSEILADYYLRQGDTVTAAAYLDTASVFSQGDEASIYACRAGRLMVYSKDYLEASNAFLFAEKEAHDVQIRFYCRYYLARAQRLMGRYYAALDGLRSLLRNDNFFDYFPLVKYQEATVLYDSGEVSHAVTAYENIDTAYSTSVAATRSAYRLAKIYLYQVGDFQSALKYFQRVTSHPNVYLISDSGQIMARTLQDYLIESYKVLMNDSLYYSALDAKRKNDTSAAYSKERIDTLYEHAAQSRDELAGLYMFKLVIPDSAINCYKTVIRDFPNSSVYQSALYSLGEYYYSSGDTASGRKYLDELINNYKDSPYALSACTVLGLPPPVVVDSSRIKYDQAVELTQNGNYNQAVDKLRELLKSPKSKLAPKALYTLGWIYETKLQAPDSAFVYYRQLSTQFPNSPYGENVKLAVTGYETAQQDSALARKARADSIAAAARLKERADSLKTALPVIKRADTETQTKIEAAPDSARKPIGTPRDTSGSGKEPSGDLIKREKK